MPLVAVAQEAGAVKVVVNGPRLLNVYPERVDTEIDIFAWRKAKSVVEVRGAKMLRCSEML